MFQQYLNEPMVLDADQASVLTLTLPSDISDFIVLQAMSAPLLELIVVLDSVRPKIAIRFQPLLELTLNSALSPNSQFGETFPRTIGQGIRLYSRMGTAPKFCADELRSGVSLKLDLSHGLSLALQSTSKFELISLEADLRILYEPRVLLMAKAILARQYDYTISSEALAVHMAEIEQVRAELHTFLRGELGQCHERLAQEAVKLEPLLLKKCQWMFRIYTNMHERPNYGRSSNDADNVDKSLRKLECYELLASPELIEMVKRLTEDEA
ncbi:hypothetical protein L2744_07840 [Shewanella profunda]|uniref:hypothetical protein n=1 Tax=Shewanella profunda TaxID=254793 RepID=UPI00200F4E26|nr:hypothetical protein [Shewanella profunda]MCL1089518.1 hypothetical protein [Shewanella profunda]